ncbi:MAG: hypothetical protein FJ029_11205 [Actinobacteria bacterium]|nr:hypothetical protein [Actinomycetota bacterium]
MSDMNAPRTPLGFLDKISIVGLAPPLAFVVYALFHTATYATSARAIATYFGGPTLVAATLAATFLLPRPTRRASLIWFWSVVVGLYVFETRLARQRWKRRPISGP